ncbi:hypothetical protein RHGRI_038926 [Rhododendron griersonianum]|uniref:Uncharacterized protein n=1 Tax=Rhododendron griersonianum TaxID=479676 RepID=A0AAV6HLX2_9ERIC|nr:hypothetical protein RHGRI_038926 [Rhododendron griersonianum]KAG5512639.1 hypothetical protein RHGRI_038926 [Rhododendron griersonianum]
MFPSFIFFSLQRIWVSLVRDGYLLSVAMKDEVGGKRDTCNVFRCAAYVRAQKQLSIHEAPNILTIVLKSFQFSVRIARPLCWVEHMSLDNETGLDPPGIRVRAVSELVAADYFAPGYLFGQF